MTRAQAFRAAFARAHVVRYRWRMNGHAPTPYRLHRDARAVMLALALADYPITPTEGRA